MRSSSLRRASKTWVPDRSARAVRNDERRRSHRAATLCRAFAAASLFIAPYSVPEFDAVRASWHASDAWLLDRNGEPLSRVRIDHDRRRGDWTALGDVSGALTDAVIASEDRRFNAHAGVDWLALGAALKQTAARERRGGSTLSMQLAATSVPTSRRAAGAASSTSGGRCGRRLRSSGAGASRRFSKRGST